MVSWQRREPGGGAGSPALRPPEQGGRAAGRRRPSSRGPEAGTAWEGGGVGCRPRNSTSPCWRGAAFWGTSGCVLSSSEPRGSLCLTSASPAWMPMWEHGAVPGQGARACGRRRGAAGRGQSKDGRTSSGARGLHTAPRPGPQAPTRGRGAAGCSKPVRTRDSQPPARAVRAEGTRSPSLDRGTQTLPSEVGGSACQGSASEFFGDCFFF